MVTAVRNSNFKYVNADLKPSDWTPAQVKLQQTVSYTPVHIRQMFAYSEHSPVAGHNLNHASLPKVSALEDYSASGWTSSYHDKIVEYSVVAEFGSGTQWIQFHGRMFTDLKILAPDSLKQLSIFMQHPSICVTKICFTVSLITSPKVSTAVELRVPFLPHCPASSHWPVSGDQPEEQALITCLKIYSNRICL